MFVPFTLDHKLLVIPPSEHKITLLIMRGSHISCHSGQDGTFIRFRAKGCWTTGGGQFAKNIKYYLS